MAQPALTYEDYTVGWICALEVEQAAARALLDSEHPRLPPRRGDLNVYRFGSINGHNVVIACLPDGETGNNSAAIVATRMISSFQNFKFGLMVGIGGGVPSSNYDIRLGDVVVSSGTGGIGGVVQYDRGKTDQGGFIRTGSLNRPPELLRQAVSDLRGTYRLKRSRLTEYLSRIVSEFDTFASPSATRGSQDILFRADYHHPQGFTAPTCDYCDATQRIQRSFRSPDPEIHYGTIASGNQVMRNGMERDRISSELDGVLCFEMEAAGLINHFPCLIIRGICDYSDSHKNKNWQAYAAAVAAAYAKELLGEIAPTDTVINRFSPGSSLAPEPPVATTSNLHSSVFINNKLLDSTTVMNLRPRIGVTIEPGRYWYDNRSGQWGYENGDCMGYFPSNLNVGGPLHPQASGYTNTQVFCNGREIHYNELYRLNRIGIVLNRGDRFWLNADRSYGREGSFFPMGRLLI